MGEDIDLQIEVKPETQPIYIDPLQIEQVLTNLCLNARDAMPKGGKFNVTVENVRFAPERRKWCIGVPAGDFVKIKVTDTGCGMSSGVVARIFEPFFTTKPEGHGTGLGLATVYGIVQEAGGDLTVESEVGHGTTFYICFPRVEDLPVESTASVQMDSATEGTETILLVEDQDALRHVTANLLREHGYTVIEAKDGKVGLDLWPMIARRVDVIITDIVMPHASGIEMVQSILKRKGAKKSLKVLFVSAYSNERLSRSGLPIHFAHFMEKPFSAQNLFRKLREILGESQALKPRSKSKSRLGNSSPKSPE